MNSLKTFAVCALLLYAPVGTSQTTEEPPVTRDVSAVRTHLVVVRDGIGEDARQAPGFSVSDQGHILTDSDGACASRDDVPGHGGRRPGVQRLCA